MSVYAKDIDGDESELEDALENDLPVSWDIATTTTLGAPLSGATFADAASLPGVVLAGDEILDIQAFCNFSGQTAGDVMEFEILWGGTQRVAAKKAVPTGINGTDGEKQVINLDWIVEDFAGTSDLKLRARVATGAGNLYVKNRHIKYKIFKKRA